jgi:hypothetical protein
MSSRFLLAIAILLAWAGGLAALARRELFKGPREQFAELALRVQPEAFYYVVEQSGRPVGYASSTIDTTGRAFVIRDDFAADLAVGGTDHRVTASSRVRVTRAFALTDFDVRVDADSAPLRVVGRTEGDSAVRFTLTGPSGGGEEQRMRVRGPILVPTLVPLAVTLGAKPKVGRRVTLPLFDPTTMATRDVTMEIVAESLFTVPDSARFDQAANAWVVAHADTVRAFRIASARADDAASRLGGWVDERGRLVEATQAPGLTIRRTAYEVAFENWRLGRVGGGSSGAGGAGVTDALETTAIAAGVTWDAPLDTLRIRLRNVALEDFDLDGGRQRLRGDTLVVTREAAGDLLAGYDRVADAGSIRARFRRDLATEPLLQAGNALIINAAKRIVGDERDPRRAVETLNAWVHDSVEKASVVGVPDAVNVLKTRRGDCNEHTQLFLALARAAGIPARAASGLAYVDGRFFYHAWPEVWLGRWVATDPTFGQFPADAAHLRFATGGLARQSILVRLIGTLQVDVLDAVPTAGRPATR